MKKLIIPFYVLLVALTFGSSHADSKIVRFQKEVGKVCESADLSVLLIKKSLIELIKGGDCDSKFTNLVLKRCDGMACGELQAIYREIQQVRSGSVVGD